MAGRSVEIALDEKPSHTNEIPVSPPCVLLGLYPEPSEDITTTNIRVMDSFRLVVLVCSAPNHKTTESIDQAYSLIKAVRRFVEKWRFEGLRTTYQNGADGSIATEIVHSDFTMLSFNAIIHISAD